MRLSHLSQCVMFFHPHSFAHALSHTRFLSSLAHTISYPHPSIARCATLSHTLARTCACECMYESEREREKEKEREKEREREREGEYSLTHSLSYMHSHAHSLMHTYTHINLKCVHFFLYTDGIYVYRWDLYTQLRFATYIRTHTLKYN